MNIERLTVKKSIHGDYQVILPETIQAGTEVVVIPASEFDEYMKPHKRWTDPSEPKILSCAGCRHLVPGCTGCRSPGICVDFNKWQANDQILQLMAK